MASEAALHTPIPKHVSGWQKNVHGISHADGDRSSGKPGLRLTIRTVLAALSDIAAGGDIAYVARGFQLFAHAKPANASFIVAHIRQRF